MGLNYSQGMNRLGEIREGVENRQEGRVNIGGIDFGVDALDPAYISPVGDAGIGIAAPETTMPESFWDLLLSTGDIFSAEFEGVDLAISEDGCNVGVCVDSRISIYSMNNFCVTYTPPTCPPPRPPAPPDLRTPPPGLGSPFFPGAYCNLPIDDDGYGTLIWMNLFWTTNSYGYYYLPDGTLDTQFSFNTTTTGSSRLWCAHNTPFAVVQGGNTGEMKYLIRVAMRGQRFSSIMSLGPLYDNFLFYDFGGENQRIKQRVGWSRTFSISPQCEQSPPPPPPPYPPPPPLPPPGDLDRVNREKEKMCCQNQKIDTALLRKIAAATYGGNRNDFPVNAVSIYNRQNRKLQSIPEMLLRLTQDLEAILGSYPIKIKVQDADAVTEGNQGQEVKIPNLAEAISEIYAMGLAERAEASVHTNFLARLATELISVEMAVLNTQAYAKANAAYLGYKGEESIERVSVNFRTDENEINTIGDFLDRDQIGVRWWTFTDNETLAEYMSRLMFSAGIIKAVFTKGLNEVTGDLDFINFEKSEDESNPTEANITWDEFRTRLNNPGFFNRSVDSEPPVVKPIRLDIQDEEG